MRLAISSLALVTCCVLGCSASGTTLKRDITVFKVITSSSPTDAECSASKELDAYLKRMQLARIAVATPSGDVAPAEIPVEIVVCRQGSQVTANMDPPLAALPDEAYALAVRGSRIYLVGADDRSVWYAVYAFLDRLGCQWLAPELDFYKGHHEHVPQVRDVVFSLPEDVIDAPALKYRKLYVEEGHSHNEANLRQMIAWMPKLRFNVLVVPMDYQAYGQIRWDQWREALTEELKRRGITIEVGGHGFQVFLNAKMEGGKFFREHPEWFAMDKTGKRTTEERWVFCSSNDQAVAHLEQGVLNYLKQNPEIDIYDFWPPDGVRWCTCSACQALGDEVERHALLVSRMASTLRRELPSVRLECLAYSNYQEPPKTITIDKSVLVDYAEFARSFEQQIYDPKNPVNQRFNNALKDWLKTYDGDVSIYSYYRKYAWRSLPNLIPHYMQNDLRHYRDAGAKGISTYAEPGDWFTYELNHYTLGHLAWNPDVDLDALIDDFCSVRYGAEANIVRGVFDELEAIVRYACSIPVTKRKTLSEYDSYAARIDVCIRKVSAASERQHGNAGLNMHLRRLGLMLEYTKRDLAIWRHLAVKGPVDERRAMVDALHAFHEKHADQGVFLYGHQAESMIRYHRLGIKRQYRQYGISRK